MSALLENPVALDLEAERNSPLPLRLNDQPEAVEPTNDSVPTTPTGYSGIEEHSTPFHAFLEYSMSLLFPALFVLCFYFSFSPAVETRRSSSAGTVIARHRSGGAIHSNFYWQEARLCLEGSDFTRKLSRLMVATFWTPVGQGPKPQKETDSLSPHSSMASMACRFLIRMWAKGWRACRDLPVLKLSRTESRPSRLKVIASRA